MIRTPLISGVLLAGLAFGATAHAAGADGRLTRLKASALLKMCQAKRPGPDQACKAYISGISDGVTLVEGVAGPKVARDVCIPVASSGDQLRSVVVGWMVKHPDRLGEDVGPVAYDALKAVFPCSGDGGTP